jgi:hypothetical protein
MDVHEIIKAVLSEDQYLPITTISDITGLTVPEVSSAINVMVEAKEVEFTQVDASIHYKLP